MDIDTDTLRGRTPCEGEGIDWGEAKECQRLPANYQKLEERHRTYFLLKELALLTP